MKVKGYQMLYADTYLSEEEFHQMFDHSLYYKVCFHIFTVAIQGNSFEKVRSKYKLEQGFPTIYSKVCKANRY